MGIRMDLRPDHGKPEDHPHEKPVTPGLWKLVTATAALLVLLVVAMEMFKDPDSAMISNPGHPALTH